MRPNLRAVHMQETKVEHLILNFWGRHIVKMLFAEKRLSNVATIKKALVIVLIDLAQQARRWHKSLGSCHRDGMAVYMPDLLYMSTAFYGPLTSWELVVPLPNSRPVNRESSGCIITSARASIDL